MVNNLKEALRDALALVEHLRREHDLMCDAWADEAARLRETIKDQAREVERLKSELAMAQDQARQWREAALPMPAAKTAEPIYVLNATTHGPIEHIDIPGSPSLTWTTTPGSTGSLPQATGEHITTTVSDTGIFNL